MVSREKRSAGAFLAAGERFRQPLNYNSVALLSFDSLLSNIILGNPSLFENG